MQRIRITKKGGFRAALRFLHADCAAVFETAQPRG